MSSSAGTSLLRASMACCLNKSQTHSRTSNVSSAFLPIKGISYPSLQLKTNQYRLRVSSCAASPDNGKARPETVEKVCKIIKKQLALTEKTPVKGESTFTELGADSLDTVEIVMGLEEEFEISVEEESAQNISTVQDAADLIEKLIKEKKDV